MKKRTTFFVLALVLVSLSLLSGCGGQSSRRQDSSGIYFYDKHGAPLSGWHKDGDNRYYLDSDGRATTGFAQVDGNTYYFGSDGTMSTGWVTVDEKHYYLRRNGVMVTGWLNLDGQRYYLNRDGSAAVGVCQVDNNAYVFDKSGRLTSGWADLGTGKAYGDANCHPLRGWNDIDGKRLYFTEDGLLCTGWTARDGFYYYYYEDGSPAQGYVTVDGRLRTFASNGQLVELVNPWNPIDEDYTVTLTQISSDHKIAAVAFADYLNMMAACTDAGFRPVVCSAYRTQEYQNSLFQNKINRVLEESPSYTLEQAQTVAAFSVAVPGTSEHQLGLAIDIVDNQNWNLDETQAQMPTQKWLMENSWRYGWILRYPNEKSSVTGIIYEPWHYRYVGREVAAEIHSLGLCLEEYLLMLTPSEG